MDRQPGRVAQRSRPHQCCHDSERCNETLHFGSFRSGPPSCGLCTQEPERLKERLSGSKARLKEALRAMEFRVLGPLEVEEDGRVLKLGGAKQRALLALLLLHANEAVSRDRLIDELWSSTPPETASAAIQVYVSQLRKAARPRRDRHAAPRLPDPGRGRDTRPRALRGDRWRVRKARHRSRPPSCSGRRSPCGGGRLWPSSTGRSRAPSAPVSTSSGCRRWSSGSPQTWSSGVTRSSSRSWRASSGSTRSASVSAVS